MTLAKSHVRALATRWFRESGPVRLLILVAVLPAVIFLMLIAIQHIFI